jgi:hypothetical protein
MHEWFYDEHTKTKSTTIPMEGFQSAKISYFSIYLPSKAFKRKMFETKVVSHWIFHKKDLL